MREMKLHPDDRLVGNLSIRFGFAAIIAVALACLVALGSIVPLVLPLPVVGPIPLSLVLAAAMIVFAVGLTGVYVLLANRSARP